MVATAIVVDDETDVRRTLQHYLSTDGFSVKLARTGKEAISKLKQLPVQVGLIDLRMPNMDGIETAEAMKSIDPNISLIAVTGFRHEFRHRLSDELFVDCVDKPIAAPRSRDTLLEKVRRGVSLYRSRCLSLDHVVDDSDLQSVRHKGPTLADREFLELLQAVLRLMAESSVDREILSRAFLSEVPVSDTLLDELRRIKVAQLARRYQADLKRLQSIASEIS